MILVGAGLWILAIDWAHTPFGQLDTRVAVLLKYISLMDIDLFEKGRSIEEIRAFSVKSGRILKSAPLKVTQVRDAAIPGPSGPVSVRVYSDDTDPGLPIVIYCHGGGWVLGSLDSHDNICRAIAKRTKAVVLAPDYGLAPEKPYPHGLDDVYTALAWVWENANTIGGDPNRIFLAGDSAGGNLAAAAALRARDSKGPPVAGQILIYPALNLKEFNTESYRMFGQGFYLTRQYMETFRSYYVPDPLDRLSPEVSPLLSDDFKGLPPALVVTAQFDVLRDEGEAYARKLEEAGVLVEIRVNGVIHGFLGMDRILPQSGQTIGEIARFINQRVRSH